MIQPILFIHGAGEGAHKEDQLLADSLQNDLGPDYNVHCPEMPDEGNAPYDLWKKKIVKMISQFKQPVILIGHSIGASHLAKILTEVDLAESISGVFLFNTPFWGGKGWLYEGYEELVVPEDAAAKFPGNAPVFLYHTRDDEVVPYSHLALYAKLLPDAVIREMDRGGHQLNNGLSQVVKDIKLLGIDLGRK